MTACVSLEWMKYLDLFDDIPYRFLKNIIHEDDDYTFDIEIEGLESEEDDLPCMCRTKITFTIELPENGEKTFSYILRYNGSSCVAAHISNVELYNDEEDEEDEEDNDEDDEEDNDDDDDDDDDDDEEDNDTDDDDDDDDDDDEDEDNK